MGELTTKRCEAWFDRNRRLAVSHSNVLEFTFRMEFSARHHTLKVTSSGDIFSRFNNFKMRSM